MADPNSFLGQYNKGRETAQEYGAFLREIFRLLRDIIKLAAIYGSIPAEVFIRHQFGERYLSPIKFIAGGVVLFFGVRFAVQATETAGFGGLIILPLYVIAGLVHIIGINIRIRKNIPWHSRSWGEPLPGWGVIPPFRDRWRLRIIGEPGLVFLIGLLIAVTQDPLAIVVMASAACMFIKAIWIYVEERSKLLDAVDAQIESIAQSELVEERTSGQPANRGWVVPPGANLLEAFTSNERSSRDQLPPKLRELIEAKPNPPVQAGDGAG